MKRREKEVKELFVVTETQAKDATVELRNIGRDIVRSCDISLSTIIGKVVREKGGNAKIIAGLFESIADVIEASAPEIDKLVQYKIQAYSKIDSMEQQIKMLQDQLAKQNLILESFGLNLHEINEEVHNNNTSQKKARKLSEYDE